MLHHPYHPVCILLTIVVVPPIECDMSAADAEHSEPLTGAKLTPHDTVLWPFDHSASHSVQNIKHLFLCSHHPSIPHPSMHATCCWLPAQQHACAPVNQSPSELQRGRNNSHTSKDSTHPLYTWPHTVHMRPCIWKQARPTHDKTWKHMINGKSVSQTHFSHVSAHCAHTHAHTNTRTQQKKRISNKISNKSMIEIHAHTLSPKLTHFPKCTDTCTDWAKQIQIFCHALIQSLKTEPKASS